MSNQTLALPPLPEDQRISAEHYHDVAHYHETMHALTAHAAGAKNVRIWVNTPDELDATRNYAEGRIDFDGLHPLQIAVILKSGLEAQMLRTEQLGYTKDRYPLLHERFRLVSPQGDNETLEQIRIEAPHLYFDTLTAGENSRQILTDPGVQAANLALVDALRAKPVGEQLSHREIAEVLEPYRIRSESEYWRVHIWADPTPDARHRAADLKAELDARAARPAGLTAAVATSAKRSRSEGKPSLTKTGTVPSSGRPQQRPRRKGASP
jgi:hypothetical protein